MSSRPAVLTRLWSLAGSDPALPSSDWNMTFERVGLNLFAPPRHGGYDCTPINSVAFATTGDDGVHYSWLTEIAIEVDFAPIMMTVPMSDTPNLVVGANLKDFLNLGCMFGYFALEQLVYDRPAAIQALRARRFDPEALPDERALLHRLTATFDLSPWEEPEERLLELERRYLHLASLPPPTDAA